MSDGSKMSDAAKSSMGMGVDAGWGALKKLTPLVGILAFLLAWQFFVILWKVPPYLLPTPTAIADTFVTEFPDLLRHGWITVYEMLLGYALAVTVAIPLAIAITSSRRFNEFVMPTMLFFQIVPKVAVAPLFLVWFGVGATPKILLAFLISFFPIVIDAADRAALDVAGNGRSCAFHGRDANCRCSRNSACRPVFPICSAA